MCCEKYAPVMDYDENFLTHLSADKKIHHRRQRMWQCRIQYFCCLLCHKGDQANSFVDVSATLADAFTYFRGYVPSDIVAGMALQAIHTKHEVYHGSIYMVEMKPQTK